MNSILRCEDCHHPMSEGIWEGGPWITPSDPSRCIDIALRQLREGIEPQVLAGSDNDSLIHYSRCDEQCKHGGPLRARHPHEKVWEQWGRELALPSLPETYKYAEIQASWRPVSQITRPSARAHTHLAVLCLRCLALKA